ncbi:MAG: restriction endonuclease subunit S [Rhizobiaceae bacterium]
MSFNTPREFGPLFQFVRNGLNVRQSKSGAGYPITRIETISDGTIDMSRVGFAGLQKEASGKWFIETGDILFSHINSVEHVGKCALFEGPEQSLVHGMNLLCLRPNLTEIYPRFAKWLIKSPNFRTLLMPFVNRAVNQASVSTKNLKGILVSIPSLEEQKRIAEILDQADALRRLRQRALDRHSTLGQSIFYEMFGDPASNPKDLPKSQLGELIKVSSGNGLTAAKMRAGRYPVYGGNGINGRHDEFQVGKDTIVIGRVGVYCGAVHVTNMDAWVTDNALVVYKKTEVVTTYLAAALKYADLNQYAGRSAQPLVSGTRIYPVEILLPSIDQQQEFEKRILISDRSIIRIQSSARIQNTLFASLQQRAFRGEL